MIKVDHLTKCYGDFCAVDDLSFEIEEGHVYGFLGPNGAGKSTTMNIITGCLSATDGHVDIDGHDIFDEPQKAKKLIGYLPEQPPLYMNESPIDYLQFVGEAKGLNGKELNEQIVSVIRQTGIETVIHKRISALSKGYKQRVGIAQALLGNPKVIILDEPTVGLDPIQIIEIRDLIKELGLTHTVIFSSHILSEVQEICDRIMIISKGKLIAFDEPQNLEQEFVSSNEICVITDSMDKTEIEGFLWKIKTINDINVKIADTDLLEIHIKTAEKDMNSVTRDIFAAFAENGKTILEMKIKKANLEDIFLELTEDKSEKADITEKTEISDANVLEESEVNEKC